MKFNKKDLALAGTSGGTITLAALYGTSQTKQEEQHDQPNPEPQIQVQEVIKEIIKDNPETLKELQREKAKNKELEGTITSLTEENERVNGELGKAEQKVKDLKEELEYERNWTTQLEGMVNDALGKIGALQTTVEAMESEKTDLQSNVSSLFNDNSSLREQNFYLTEAYNNLSASFSAYRDAMINALNKERNTIRIKEKPGCWYSNSQSDNKGTWGLNCNSVSVLLDDGKEYILDKLTGWATQTSSNLWNYFSGRAQVYGTSEIQEVKP